MANVSIKFNGKEFLLSCEDGQEEHLEELLIQINKKFNNLKNEIEINQRSYEKLIDEAADEISNFVEKANLENISK